MQARIGEGRDLEREGEVGREDLDQDRVVRATLGEVDAA